MTEGYLKNNQLYFVGAFEICSLLFLLCYIMLNIELFLNVVCYVDI